MMRAYHVNTFRRVIVDGMEALQVACTATALAVLRSQTIWRTRRLSMFHRSRAYNRNINMHQARHMA